MPINNHDTYSYCILGLNFLKFLKFRSGGFSSMDVKFECSSLNVLNEIGKKGTLNGNNCPTPRFQSPRRFLTRVDMTQNPHEQNPINFVPSNSKLIAVHPQQHSILSHIIPLNCLIYDFCWICFQNIAFFQYLQTIERISCLDCDLFDDMCYKLPV